MHPCHAPLPCAPAMCPCHAQRGGPRCMYCELCMGPTPAREGPLPCTHVPWDAPMSPRRHFQSWRGAWAMCHTRASPGPHQAALPERGRCSPTSLPHVPAPRPCPTNPSLGVPQPPSPRLGCVAVGLALVPIWQGCMAGAHGRGAWLGCVAVGLALVPIGGHGRGAWQGAWQGCMTGDRDPG